MIYTALLLVFLVLCISFFSSSETAFLSLSRIKIRQMIRAKEAGAERIERLHSDMDSLLTIVLIGINFISTLASSVGAALAIEIAGAGGAGVASGAATFFITVFGEIVPKTIATEKPEKIAMKSAFVLSVLERVFRPLVQLFSAVSKAASAISGLFWKSDDALVTEEELKTLIDVGASEGTLESGEKVLLYRLFEFSDLHVHDIMKHRSFIRGIFISSSWDDVVQSFLDYSYSRLPVYEADGETIVGLLHYKSVLFARNNEMKSKLFVKRNMRPALFVPESLTALELLRTFKREKQDIAVALNEQGGVAGIVTADDLLRTVFGRMTDEFSSSDAAPESRIKIISTNEFVVPGDMKLPDVNALLHLKLESDEYNTLGGWLLEKFDALPSVGETVKFGNASFVVEDQNRRRIQLVRIKIMPSLQSQR